MQVSWLSMRSSNKAPGSGGGRSGASAASLSRAVPAILAIAWLGAWEVVFQPPAAAEDATPPAQDAAAKSEAKPAEASSEPIDGATLFAGTCGFCHQNGGRVAGKGPKLMGNKLSDDFIVNRIKKGKTGAMPAFGHVFEDDQIKAILAYIRGLGQ